MYHYPIVIKKFTARVTYKDLGRVTLHRVRCPCNRTFSDLPIFKLINVSEILISVLNYALLLQRHH